MFYQRFIENNEGITCGRYLRLQEYLRKKRKENVLFCDHPKTITAGIQSKPENLKRNSKQIALNNIEYYKMNRGGDYTAHEPGQCIIYPHFDLKKRNWKISDFITMLMDTTTESIYDTWSIECNVRRDIPGIYTNENKKIASVGFVVRSDFSSFGIALNVSNDLMTFDNIIPCGQPDIEITSIVKEGADGSKRGEFVHTWTEKIKKFI